jgi:hypothetical protein
VIRCGVLDQNPRMASGVERRRHMEKPERDAPVTDWSKMPVVFGMESAATFRRGL